MNTITIKYTDLNRIMRDYKSTLKSKPAKRKPVLGYIKCVVSGNVFLTSCTDGFRVIQDRTVLTDSNVDSELNFLLPYVALTKSSKDTLIKISVGDIELNKYTVSLEYSTGVNTGFIVDMPEYPDLSSFTSNLNDLSNQTYVGSITPAYFMEALKTFDKNEMVSIHSKAKQIFYLTSLDNANHKALVIGCRCEQYDK